MACFLQYYCNKGVNQEIKMGRLNKNKNGKHGILFCQCDKCIGITPCKVTKKGKIICDYCKCEVNLHRFLKSEQPEISHFHSGGA